ncbi:MAG: M48 family metallopeptidase, partial [Candidatus Tectomicrobia bacterium]|nr:M48 family metallopeptidase [Candidatus Tectomicrobia bacterium]
DPTVNALAAPGGFIVVFRGLLERTRTAEELAGVLAHEVEHVLQRHATKALVQHVSTGLLFTAVTGDVSGVMAYGLESARVLGALRYSRAAEEEADAEGLQLLLAARVDPAGMIAFFEGMESQRAAAPAVLKYLSTHPATGDRLARLRQLARGGGQRPPVRLLEGYEWADIRRICG